ncbi:hypothetical protein BH23PAT2_BH23PAT2_05200 [soil metagenome]
MNKRNQDGIAHTGLVIFIVVVLALVGFAFWRIQDQASNDTNPESTTNIEESNEQIENEDDLREAEETLNATDFDEELDTTEIDETLQ